MSKDEKGGLCNEATVCILISTADKQRWNKHMHNPDVRILI